MTIYYIKVNDQYLSDVNFKGLYLDGLVERAWRTADEDAAHIIAHLVDMHLGMLNPGATRTVDVITEEA